MKPIRLTIIVVMVSCLAALSTSCIYSEEIDDQLEFDGVYPADFDWDFHRTVTLQFEVSPDQRPIHGVALAEVRQTLFGGPLVFKGYLNNSRGWDRTLTFRLPRHESEISVTVQTRDGIVRHVVPIDEDGRAFARFE